MGSERAIANAFAVLARLYVRDDRRYLAANHTDALITLTTDEAGMMTVYGLRLLLLHTCLILGSSSAPACRCSRWRAHGLSRGTVNEVSSDWRPQ
jgi:hypothetical protein